MKKFIGILFSLLLMAVPVFAAAADASAEYITDDAYWQGYDDGYNGAYNDGYSNGYSDGYYDGLNGNEYYDYTEDYSDDYEYHEMCWVKLNGDYVWFENQDAVLIEGSAFVPMREMCEKLGAEVVWDGETRSVSCLIDDKIITFTVDSADYTINGEHFTLPVKVQLVNGCTMLPVRAFCEAFGATVEWDNEEKDVIISYLRKLNDDEQLVYDALTKTDSGKSKADFNINLVNIGASDAEIDSMDISGSLYTDGANALYLKFKAASSMYYDIVSVNADVEAWIFAEEDSPRYYLTINGREIVNEDSYSDIWVSDFYEELCSIISYDSINSLFMEIKGDALPSVDNCDVIKLYHEPEYLYDDLDSGESVYGNDYEMVYYISKETGNIEKLIINGEIEFSSNVNMEATFEYDNIEIPVLPFSAKESLKSL